MDVFYSYTPKPLIRGGGGGGSVTNDISLGDIQNLPTFWVLALFGTFYNFCFCVQTCRHLSILYPPSYYRYAGLPVKKNTLVTEFGTRPLY